MYRKFLSLTMTVSCACILSCSDSPTEQSDGGSWTVSGDLLTDPDGNVYHSVKIGSQVWTVENLRVTKYNDRTAIPHVPDITEWSNLSTPGYCYYNNVTNPDTIKKWGALYNWHVVSPANPKQIAPAGWHVPTDADWTTLLNYLIANGYNWDGTTAGNKIAKAVAARTDWMSSSTAGGPGNNPGSNNSSGFSALPGGRRDIDGSFLRQSSGSHWWSATEADVSTSNARYLSYYYERLGSDVIGKRIGQSVRLVRD